MTISLEKKGNAVNDVQFNCNNIGICCDECGSGDDITFVCPCYHSFCSDCINEARKVVCHYYLILLL